MFAYEVAQAIDLDEAERRLFAGTERQTIKQNAAPQPPSNTGPPHCA